MTQSHQTPTTILLVPAVVAQGYSVRQNLVVAGAKTILHSLETSCWKIPFRLHSLRVRRQKPFSAADVSPELSKNAHPLHPRPVMFSNYLLRLRAHWLSKTVEEAAPMPRAVGSMEQAKRLFSKRCSSVVSCANDPQRTPFSNGSGNEVIVSGLDLGS